MGARTNKGTEYPRLWHQNLTQVEVYFEEETQSFIVTKQIACLKPLQI